MTKTTGDGYLYFLIGLLAVLPASAFSESSTGDLTRVTRPIAAPPPMEVDMAFWAEDAYEESLGQFREQWRAEARQIFSSLGSYDTGLAMAPTPGRRLAEEAQETLAGILASRQDDKLVIEPEVESLAAN